MLDAEKQKQKPQEGQNDTLVAREDRQHSSLAPLQINQHQCYSESKKPLSKIPDTTLMMLNGSHS